MTEGAETVATGNAPRNPSWAWEELVLACDLVMANRWHELDSGDKRVIELSHLLQRLPIHAAELRTATFRSPHSVRRKMADIATHHPDDVRKPTNGGKLDLEVLGAFISRPTEMHALAQRLRSGERAGEFENLPPVDPDAFGDPDGVGEGRLLERVHRRRERDPALRRQKEKQALARHGRLRCEVCDFDFAEVYGPRGAGYFECHHVVPLHVSGETKTRLADLAVLCANCHRMIHRSREWLTPDELRHLVEAQRRG